VSGASGKPIFGGFIEVTGGDAVSLRLHPAGPDGAQRKLIYASCPECHALYVDLPSEAFVCMCTGKETRCPVRFGKVRVRVKG
jgi:hypothetical protein